MNNPIKDIAQDPAAAAQNLEGFPQIVGAVVAGIQSGRIEVAAAGIEDSETGAALLIGAAASLLVEFFTWRRMRMVEHFVPLVSSMAFLILFEHLAIVFWGSELRTLPALFGNAG